MNYDITVTEKQRIIIYDALVHEMLELKRSLVREEVEYFKIDEKLQDLYDLIDTATLFCDPK